MARRVGRKLQHKHAWDVAGTWFQGGRQEVQYFLGDLVECRRDGHWQFARVSRAPTDEKPHDGSFRVKFDSDAIEMKCWYKDLRKPSRIAVAPSWLSSWTPEVAPPDPNSWSHLEVRAEAKEAKAWWRHGPPADAKEINEAEHAREAELWARARAEEELLERELERQRRHYEVLQRDGEE